MVTNWSKMAWAFAIVIVIAFISAAIADSWLAGWMGGVVASAIYHAIDPVGIRSSKGQK